jgi:transcriptional regulator with XRE-family HTH domain
MISVVTFNNIIMPRRTLRPLAIRLGRHISKRRKAMGLTQEKIAELLEVEPITISRYETGAALPSLASLSVLAESLGTTMGVLLDEVVDPVEHRADAERVLGRLSPLTVQERQWVLKMVDEMVSFCVAPKPMGRPRKKALAVLEEIAQSPLVSMVAPPHEPTEAPQSDTSLQ